jgi:hypothetical protein
MKRNILIISILILGSMGMIAQNEQDALRYSYLNTGGTTRAMSMGGAFGAVGGDFSSMAINPAGLGIYRQGEFSFTPEFNLYSTDASYLGSSMHDTGYKTNISHFGFVLPFTIKNESSGIKGLSFAVGYNKLKDFGQNITMKGINNSNSLVDEFVYSANHNNGWDPFTDGLAWETYLIDYDSLAGVYYSDFDNSNYGQTQKRSVLSRGSMGEFDFSLGANLSDRLYLGMTMGIVKAGYDERWVHSETDPNDVINFFESFSFTNQLSTSGSGINFKLGILGRPVDFIRLGASLQTPTVLKFNDVFRASMSTLLADGQPAHEWDNEGEFDYTITTPLRATGSIAFIYKQYGLISLDYEYVDFTSARLSSNDYDFFNENEAIGQRFKATSNIRLGGEFRLGKYYLRAGYGFYGNPYAEGEANSGKGNSILSGGIGYKDKNMYIDFGLARSAWDQEYFLYGNNSAGVTNVHTRFSTTLGFRF